MAPHYPVHAKLPPREAIAEWASELDAAAPTAFERHLRTLASCLELQVSLARSAVELGPVSAPSDFREVAEDAIDKFAESIGRFRLDLLGAAKGRQPPPLTPTTAAALESPHSELDLGDKEVPCAVKATYADRSISKETPQYLSETSKALSHRRFETTRHGVESVEDDASAKSWDTEAAAATTSRDAEKSQKRRAARVCIGGVLNPGWGGRLAWDFLVIFLVLVDGLILPVQLAEFLDNGAFDDFWLWFTTSFFLSDLAMNFVTGYMAGKHDVDLQEGTLVTDKVRIARHYFRGWFWIDFLSTVPWTVLADALRGTGGNKNAAGNVTKITKIIKLTRLLRLIRMLRLCKVSSMWQRLEGHIGSITFLNVVSMLKALGVVFAICHWGACVWWMVGKEGSIVTALTMQEGSGELHWTSLPRAHSPYDDVGEWRWIHKPATEQYVFCFYWILGVMRTMPAEVTPVNLTERLFVLCFMFFAVGAFAVFVARITQAYFRFGARKDAFREELACVRMHLRGVNCDRALQARITAYLTHIFEWRRIHAKEVGLLGALPDGLRQKLMNSRLTHHLRKLEVLRDKSDTMLRRVCRICEVIDFLPGDRITEKDKPAKAAFLLMRGGLRLWAARPSGASEFERQVSSSSYGASRSLGLRGWSSQEASPSSSRSAATFSLGLKSWSAQELGRSKLTIVDECCLNDRAEVLSRHTVFAQECSEVMRVDRDKCLDIIQGVTRTESMDSCDF